MTTNGAKRSGENDQQARKRDHQPAAAEDNPVFLPNNVVSLILSHLPQEDLNNASQASDQFRALAAPYQDNQMKP